MAKGKAGLVWKGRGRCEGGARAGGGARGAGLEARGGGIAGFTRKGRVCARLAAAGNRLSPRVSWGMEEAPALPWGEETGGS